MLREVPCAKLEEKEKQEKIRQLKTRDPKDMTVIAEPAGKARQRSSIAKQIW